MYITTTAARISHRVLDSEARKASAAPWKVISTACGRPIRFIVASMPSTAWPSEAPAARLKDTVAAGNWPWCDSDSTAGRWVMRATVESGTGPPVPVGT